MHAAAMFQLERLSPGDMYLAAGHSAIYLLRVRNIGNATDSVQLSTQGAWDRPPYVLTQASDPACGSFIVEPPPPLQFIYWTRFSVGPIAPGAAVDCAISVTRDAASLSDASLAWMLPGQSFYEENTTALIGTLTDVSVQTQALDFSIDASGLAHSTIELTVHNAGSVPVSEQSAGFCEDNMFRPFLTDGSGPGGCGDDNNYACFDWGYGFSIPQLGSGDTYQCRIRLQSLTTYTQPLDFPIMVEPYQQSLQGGTLLDINPADNIATLHLGPLAASIVAVPWGGIAGLIALVASMLIVATVRLRSIRARLVHQ